MSNNLNLTLINSNLPTYFNIQEGMNFQLLARIQFDESTSPSWNTPEGELSILDEEMKEVSIPLSASPSTSATIMKYGLMPSLDGEDGYLPFGLTLNDSSGLIEGNLERVVNHSIESTPFLESERPTWNTESKTWFYNEEVMVNESVSAISNTESTLAYRIQKGHLPWGITLTNDGDIIGETQYVVFGDDDTSTASPPRWDSPLGTIISCNELEKVSYQLQAQLSDDNPSGTLFYTVVGGNLPWGITMGSSGNILGTNTEVIIPETSPSEIFPKPKWVTPFGIIKKLNEKESVDIPLEATPVEENAVIHFRIVNGNLPWGITLSKDGRLFGLFDEIMQPELPVIIDDNAPIINTISLGSYELSSDVDDVIDVDIYEGRTIKQFYLESSSRLPLGLVIDEYSNSIRGTVSSDTEPGLFNITLTVVDSANMRSSRVISVSVF